MRTKAKVTIRLPLFAKNIVAKKQKKSSLLFKYKLKVFSIKIESENKVYQTQRFKKQQTNILKNKQ